MTVSTRKRETDNQERNVRTEEAGIFAFVLLGTETYFSIEAVILQVNEQSSHVPTSRQIKCTMDPSKCLKGCTFAMLQYDRLTSGRVPKPHLAGALVSPIVTPATATFRRP